MNKKVDQLKKIYREAHNQEAHKLAEKKIDRQIDRQMKDAELQKMQDAIIDVNQIVGQVQQAQSAHSHQIIGGGTYTYTTGGTTYPATSPNYYPPPSTGVPYIPPSGTVFGPHMVPAQVIEIEDSEDLVELIAMLEVEPGGGGLLLRIRDVDYSLINILKAQVAMMMRMNILLMHRLGPNEED